MSIFHTPRALRQFRVFSRPVKRRTKSTARLQLEVLENRTLPTILVPPAFGPEAVASDNGHKLNGSVPVFLILWGEGWQGTNSIIARNIENAAAQVLGSTYLQGVKEYGSDGNAHLQPPVVWHATNPANPFKGQTNGDAIADIVYQEVYGDHAHLPEPDTQGHSAAIYVVVTLPGVVSDNRTASGYNTDYVSRKVGDIDDTPAIWASTSDAGGTTINLDHFTLILSHELAEIMTDFPQGEGIQVTPPAKWVKAGGGGEGNQIGDYEGNQYFYRLSNGPLVQPTWSDVKKQWIVTDGRSQLVTAQASQGAFSGSTFNGSYDVSINTGQLPAVPIDNIHIGTAFVGGRLDLQINLNGELFQFDMQGNGWKANALVKNLTIYCYKLAGITIDKLPVMPNITVFALSSAQGVTINTEAPLTVFQGFDCNLFITTAASALPGVLVEGRSGSITIANQSNVTVDATKFNTVNVSQNSGSGKLTINNAGKIVLGVGGTVSSFTAGLSIPTSPLGGPALVIDDSADRTRKQIGVNAGEVDGLTDPIYFGLLSSLTVIGGYGGNLFTVFDTPSGAQLVELDTGRGDDAVVVQYTRGPLLVNGVDGNDTVTVGDKASVRKIAGSVTIRNTGGHTALNLFDNGDDQDRNVVMQAGIQLGWITGLAPATILFGSQELASLSVSGGTGHNTFTIVGTPVCNLAAGGVTIIHTGPASGTVLVYGTTGALGVDCQGTSFVTVGTPSTGLDSINGPISIKGQNGLVYLLVDDKAATATHTYSVSNQLVRRQDRAEIFYHDIYSLTLNTGTHADTVTVTSTMRSGSTTINTGGGFGTVRIISTAGDLQVSTYGNTFISVGASGLLDYIQGAVRIFTGYGANNYVTLSLDDTAETNPEELDISSDAVGTTFRRSGDALIGTNGFSQLGLFQWLGGKGGDTLNVRGRPGQATNLVLGPGDDLVKIGTAAGTLSNFGTFAVRGGKGLDKVILDDSGEARDQTYTVSAAFVGTQFAQEVLTTRGTTVGVFPDVEEVDLNGGIGNNSVNVSGTLAGIETVLSAGLADPTIVIGKLLSDIHGPLMVHGDGAVGLVVDDTSDPHSTSYTITSTTIIGGGAPVIAAASISYQGVTSVSLLGSHHGGKYLVQSTLAGTPVSITPGSYGDSVQIGDADHALDQIQATVSLGLKPGSSLLASDVAATTVHDIEISTSGLNRDGQQLVALGDTQPALFTFNAGAGGDGATATVIDVASSAAGSSVVVNCGPDEDEIDLIASQNAIQGPVTIHGAPAAADFLFYDDTNNPKPQTYTFTADKVSRFGLADVTFDGLNEVVLFSAVVGGNRMNVRSAAADTLVNLLTNNLDRVVVGGKAPNKGGDVDAILGPVEVHSADPNAQVRLTVDDSGDAVSRQVALAPDQELTANGFLITGLAPGPILGAFSTGSQIAILGGSGGNTFNVQGTPAGNSVTLKTGIGDDTVNVGNSLDNFQGPLTINGQGGTNTLDYSSYDPATGVYVNLQTGTATGLAGGIRNIQNVIGSAGNDILVGNGASVLTGGAGDDLLIAGPGNGSTLNGGSGSNILIGGRTDYDRNRKSLQAILDAWNQAPDYQTGVAVLVNALLGPDHVHRNLGGNQLTGGPGLDLFFASNPEEVQDLEPGEVLVPI